MAHLCAHRREVARLGGQVRHQTVLRFIRDPASLIPFPANCYALSHGPDPLDVVTV